jgi:L-fuculose-phosphate aldolase
MSERHPRKAARQRHDVSKQLRRCGPPEEHRRARERVAAAGRRLAAERLVLGNSGNVSARVGELVAASASGARLAELTAAEVVLVDLEGELVEGELEPTSELELHLGIYRRFASGAVVHTHSPMATALACVLDEVPVVHYGMLSLGGAVPVAPYATFGSRELAEATVAALEGRRAALMANHGAIVHADGLEQAVELALLLEWACGLWWHASVLGHPRTLDRQSQEAVTEEIARRRYGAPRRREAT